MLPSRFPLHAEAAALPADAVWCVSAEVARVSRKLYPDRHAVVVHPGVDLDGEVADRAAARAALELPADAFVVGVVGRIEPWKGQDVMLRALRLLRERGVRAHCVLVGQRVSLTWPGFAKVVERLVDDLGLRKHVTFTGHVTSSSAMLGALDVLVCSSREEGFSLALVEAMAAGVPVIATRCGGPEEMVTDTVTALLTPVDAPEALADAMGRLVLDPPLAHELSSAAGDVYQRRFTAEHGAARFLTALQGLSVIGS